MWTWESIRPGIAVMPPASISTSYSPSLPPVPTDSILPAVRMIVSPTAVGAARSPVRILPRLKIATFIPLRPLVALACDDFIVSQAADPGIQAPPVGNAEDDGHFVRHRCIRQHHGHAVVMRTYVNVVFVVHRDIDESAGAALLRKGRNPGIAAANCVTDGVGEGGREQGVGVLLLAVQADNAALAVALDLVLAEGPERQCGDLVAKLHAALDHRLQIVDVSPRIGVLDDRDGGDAPQRPLGRPAGFFIAFFHDGEAATNGDAHDRLSLAISFFHSV